ncbi:MAG TPA: phosphopyruvate hydratase [Peptococcaceae bacterium]|nr:phosphopyruvate hydratase [Peptococcaceae bacterium]
MDKIEKITGREILNARGKPTVEVEVITSSGIITTASVPSGTSKGKYEAHELYDGEKRYHGYGVKKAVNNVNTVIREAILGWDVIDQRGIDRTMIALDGTKNKSRLGGNAILATSVAVAKAGAQSVGLPLYRYLGGIKAKKLPNIVATVISGGEFSPSGLEFEDYLLILEGFNSFADSLEALVEMRSLLQKKLIAKYGYFPEDGGALAPPLSSTEEAFEYMLGVAREVGCEKNVSLGLDVAANELYDPESGCYNLSKGRMSPSELISYYKKLCTDYPLTFIEDPFEQDQLASFAELKKELPEIQIVGDDLFVTNVERIKLGIENDCANTLLFKINQIGTISEAIDAAILAQNNNLIITASLRSGETTDDFIADMAVGIGAKQIKLGSPVRGERNTKYNRLLKIESELAEF